MVLIVVATGVLSPQLQPWLANFIITRIELGPLKIAYLTALVPIVLVVYIWVRSDEFKELFREFKMRWQSSGAPLRTDIAVKLGLYPQSQWYRATRSLHLGHVVVGESYNILVWIKNLRETPLATVTANLRITISIDNGQTPFNASVSGGPIDSKTSMLLKSNEGFLIRRISQGDLQMVSAFTDAGNTRLRIAYQGGAGDDYLTSYEVEPRKAVSDRIATIIQIVFGTSFVAIVLQLLGLKML